MIYHIITDNVNFLCYNNYKLKIVKFIKLISKALPGPKVVVTDEPVIYDLRTKAFSSCVA